MIHVFNGQWKRHAANARSALKDYDFLIVIIVSASQVYNGGGSGATRSHYHGVINICIHAISLFAPYGIRLWHAISGGIEHKQVILWQ